MLATLAAATLIPLSARAEHIQIPTGDLRSAVLTDLRPHASGSKTYNEFWTYHFFLDGNIQVILNFSRANLGSFKAPVCGADLTIMGLKGKNYTVAREYEKKNFAFADSNQELRVHEKIFFSGKLPESHRVHFATTKKDVAYLLDLDFSDVLPGKVWGDGMFKFGSEDAVGIFIHIPSAKVTGKLAIKRIPWRFPAAPIWTTPTRRISRPTWWEPGSGTSPNPAPWRWDTSSILSASSTSCRWVTDSAR